MADKTSVLTFRSFLAGALFTAFFAWLTVLSTHRGPKIEATATQIAVFPYVLLFLMVLLLNPFLRLIRFIRPFSPAEVLVVFIMGAVSAGISIYGYTDQLLPISGSLYYKDWNTTQAQWDRYIEPYVSEKFFLGEDGIQDAARKYRDAADERDRLQRVYTKAVGVSSRQAQAGDAGVDWAALTKADRAEPLEVVLRDYPARLAAQEELVSSTRAGLMALKQKAFAKVELFRRGLPETLRAYPGVIPLSEDDATSYFGRLKRLVKGKSAAAQVEQAAEKLATRGDYELVDQALAEQSATLLSGAAEQLEALRGSEDLSATKAALEADLSLATRDLAETNTQLEALNQKKRWAALSEQSSFDGEIGTLSKRKNELTAAKKKIDAQLAANLAERRIAERVAGTADASRKLGEQVRTDRALTVGALKTNVAAVLERFPSFDVSYRRYFFGDVPWSDWVGPLLRWGFLMVVTYVVLMAFNVLIFRQWAHNEKLIYPLTELPEILVGHGDRAPGVIPEIFRSGLFWLGLAASGLLLGWNLLVYSQMIPGAQTLDLTNNWQPYIQGTVLQGLLPNAKAAVFFTMLGLAFFIPAKVSFSLWFFYCLSMVQVLLLVWFGYGESERSFPSEWYHVLNFRTSEGSGALLVFAFAILYKCRKYLLCMFSPSAVQDLALDEQKELRIHSFLFLGGTFVLIGYLWLGMGANLFYTVVYYGIIMAITIGLMRAVAEGGILGFQAFTGPFHLLRTLFGLEKWWCATPLMSPLLLYHCIFFLDIKTLIAPAMANSLKMREDLRMERRRFHVAIWTAILLAAVLSVVVSLMMCYSPGQGANAMNDGFYGWLPRNFLPYFKSLHETPPEASLSNAGWIGVGAAAMGLLLFFRQSFFWLPHPIGLVMLVNPIMSTYWFSILLGWLAKALVTRYGNRDTYLKTRALFIGLIVGELLIVTLGLCLSYALEVKVPIDLNRNAD